MLADPRHDRERKHVMRANQVMRKKKPVSKVVEPFLYLLPAIIFFILFTYYPFIKTAISSLFMVDSMGRSKAFVGLENFIRVLSSPAFLISIKNTFIYMLLSAPVSIFIALILALVAHKKTRSSRISETLFALTMAMSMSVSAMIFKLAYNPTIGALNFILGTRINWLNSSEWAMVAISMISVWMGIGFNFLFLLAAIFGISPELLESASIDGARMYRKTVSIILPMISPTLFFLIITSMAKNMMMSGLVLIFTNSGSLSTTANVETMISYMYKQAVNNLNYNDAYAAAMVAFVLTFIMMLISFRFEKKGVFYN
jgi:sn-glycerol 3-phosphate transport system permease protein